MSDSTTQGAVPASSLVRRELLDEKAAAELLDIAPGTLSVWRSTGRYRIPFVKVGRRVRYRRADLEAWLESRTRTNGATE
jgi:excisionase family DNA binding protein